MKRTFLLVMSMLTFVVAFESHAEWKQSDAIMDVKLVYGNEGICFLPTDWTLFDYNKDMYSGLYFGLEQISSFGYVKNKIDQAQFSLFKIELRGPFKDPQSSFWRHAINLKNAFSKVEDVQVDTSKLFEDKWPKIAFTFKHKFSKQSRSDEALFWPQSTGANIAKFLEVLAVEFNLPSSLVTSLAQEFKLSNFFKHKNTFDIFMASVKRVAAENDELHLAIQREKAEQERQKAEEIERRRDEQERQKKAQEEQQRRAEQERQRKAQEEQQRRAEQEHQRKAQEEQQRRAEQERQRKAQEEQRRRDEQERQRKAQEEQQRRAAKAKTFIQYANELITLSDSDRYLSADKKQVLAGIAFNLLKEVGSWFGVADADCKKLFRKLTLRIHPDKATAEIMSNTNGKGLSGEDVQARANELFNIVTGLLRVHSAASA